MKRHFIWLIASLFFPGIASAQDVRRCVRADNSVVFTDKSCSDTEVEKQTVQTLAIPAHGKSIYPIPESCSHSASDLLYNVRTAIDMHNANQLAKYYHWVGLSDVQAENILNRLELLVIKPLVDIRLIQANDGNANTQLAEQAIDSEIQAPVQQNAAVALKVIQYQSNGTQLESTQFHLQRNFNCWWLRY